MVDSAPYTATLMLIAKLRLWVWMMFQLYFDVAYI